MFYNRLLRVWVVDPVDYFLLSAFIGSLAASHLKRYLAEKAAMERLKNSIIRSSKLAPKSNIAILNSQETKIKKIYKFALENRGGQFDELQADYELSNEVFNLAQKIQGLVERLAVFLKQRELKGIAKLFFRNGRLILELILYKCNINITYSLLNEGLSKQVIVITASLGGAAGFTLSWFSVGACLVAPPILISTLLLRSFTQQILNQIEYSNFKKIFKKMLKDDDLKETLQIVFIEQEVLTPISDRIRMEPLDLDKNSALTHDFDLKSGEDFEQFLKSRMKEELGLIENPTETQLKEIIQKKLTKKVKGKTVFFRDFIDEIPYEGADLSDTDLLDNILDAEILEEPIRTKLDNQL